MSSPRPQGQPVPLSPAHLPTPTTLKGRTINLEKLTPTHATDLFPLIGGLAESTQSLWTYMFDGPYEIIKPFTATIASKSASRDPFFYAVIDLRPNLPTSGKAIGYLSLMRITPEHLSIEIGNVMFSPALQRTTGATEAIYLLAGYAFSDLGYRRLEWKCDSLNEPSRKAAARLGFVFEGVFRQHMVVKGRNRDTAWYSVLRGEWEGDLKGAMEGWLDVGNFGDDGGQILGLREFRGRVEGGL
jgi:RimJ/RimL family protein N-acetyltransferase